MKMKWRLRRYFWQIGALLPCGRRERRGIMAGFREQVARYCHEEPDAGFGQLVAHFGTPEQVAATYLGELNQHELLDVFRLRQRIVRVVAGAMAVAVLIASCAAIAIVCENRDTNPAVVEVDIAERDGNTKICAK